MAEASKGLETAAVLQTEERYGAGFDIEVVSIYLAVSSGRLWCFVGTKGKQIALGFGWPIVLTSTSDGGVGAGFGDHIILAHLTPLAREQGSPLAYQLAI